MRIMTSESEVDGIYFYVMFAGNSYLYLPGNNHRGINKCLYYLYGNNSPYVMLQIAKLMFCIFGRMQVKLWYAHNISCIAYKYKDIAVL